MIAPSPAIGTVLEDDGTIFRDQFERTPFAFRHNLANHPLFEVDRLIECAQSLSGDPYNLVYHEGEGRVDERWDQVPMAKRSVDTMMRQIETEGAWILLKRANLLPGHDQILAQCLRDIERLTGRPTTTYLKSAKSIVFMNSPHRTTAYHIDQQLSLLLQIRGTKTISIFNRFDREVLPETELERFWMGDDNAAIYKPQFQDRATVFEMVPGTGVHIPLNAPHWVQNGPEVSVSLNINLDIHDHLAGDIHRMNHVLRKWGFSPAPAFASPVVDSIKASAYGLARGVRKTIRRG